VGAALEERACEKAIAREGLACYGSHRATGERYPRLLASLDDIETRANPLLVRIFSRPGEFAFELASNVATQDLGRMLASLSAGEPDGMMALIGNRGTPSRPRRRPGGHQKHRLAGSAHSSHHTQARTQRALFLWQQQKVQEVLRRRLSESSSKRKCSTRHPPVGEQLVELVLGAEADAGKGIPQVGERIDA